MGIRLKLEELALDYDWSGESNRWVRQYEVFLEDLNQPKRTWFRRRLKRQIGDKSWVIVCSKEFLEQPNDEFSPPELHKAVVQEEFSLVGLKGYLQEKIDNVGEVSATELFQKLEEFLILESENN